MDEILAFRREIGRRLRARRIDLGWSLAGVAYRMDVREATVCRWENGQRALSVDTLHRLGCALGCDPRELLPAPGEAGRPTLAALAQRNGYPDR